MVIVCLSLFPTKNAPWKLEHMSTEAPGTVHRLGRISHRWMHFDIFSPPLVNIFAVR